MTSSADLVIYDELLPEFLPLMLFSQELYPQQFEMAV